MYDTAKLISIGLGALCWLPSRLPVPCWLTSHPSWGALRARGGEGTLVPSCRAPQGHDQIPGFFAQNPTCAPFMCSQRVIIFFQKCDLRLPQVEKWKKIGKFLNQKIPKNTKKILIHRLAAAASRKIWKKGKDHNTINQINNHEKPWHLDLRLPQVEKTKKREKTVIKKN